MNIGFYLLNIDQTNKDAQSCLQAANELCAMRPRDNIVVFSTTPDAIITNNKYYMLHITHAKFFKGALFMFDNKSRLLTQTFKTPSKQIIYVQDIPWGKANQQDHYSQWERLYNTQDVEFIANSEDTSEILDICWKKPLSVMPTVTAKDINDVIENKI
jgi:hypothetical protein